MESMGSEPAEPAAHARVGTRPVVTGLKRSPGTPGVDPSVVRAMLGEVAGDAPGGSGEGSVRPAPGLPTVAVAVADPWEERRATGEDVKTEFEVTLSRMASIVVASGSR